MKSALRSATFIFREPAKTNLNRTAFGYLEEELWGPVLKSYWPPKVTDISLYGKDIFSTEIPLSQPDKVISLLTSSRKRLPISLNAVYRSTISQWRRNRERGTIGKNGSLLSATNLGKLATKPTSRVN